MQVNSNNIAFVRGLSNSEVIEIEHIYSIKFPPPLREFLMDNMPINGGFYNWRDTNKDNIDFIKSVIHAPINNILSAASEIEWNNKWGKEPTNIIERKATIINKIKTAPALIPVYSHRYMPSCSLLEYPIISVSDIDIVYYGKSLNEYLQIEFGKASIDMNMDNYEYIPFWTDIM